MSIQDKDFNWFVDHYKELFCQYGVCYLVIKNQKILGSYTSLIEALNKTKATEEVGTFIVQYCDGTEEAYTNYIATVGAVLV